MKKILCRLVSITLCLFLLPCRDVFAAEGDEVRSAKKIISVVFDDSGSMQGSRWSYTNYSMQALISLLNEQDELYITFMSAPNKAESVNTSDLTKEIKKIRSLSDMGGTPAMALETAYSKLNSIKEKDASTQFWFVLLTDGGVADLGTTLQNKLDSYKNTTMSNSSQMNMVYMSMASAEQVQGDPQNNFYTYDAQDDSAIVSSLQDVANLISGRIAADDISQIDDKTISVSSKLPVYSISVLSQRSSAEVKSVKTNEESLKVIRNIKLDATNLANGERLDTLYGNASVANLSKNGKAQVIPADEYTIKFSDKVNVNDITVQYEPAISLKAEIIRNGTVIDDPADLSEGDKVDINMIPIIPGTNEVIAESDLPDKIKWKTEYEVDGKIKDSGNGISLTGVELVAGSGIIRGTIEIPGYAPLINEILFKINEEPKTDLAIITDNADGISYRRYDIKDLQLGDGNTVRFTITNFGEVMDKTAQKDLKVSLKLKKTGRSKKDYGSFFGNFGLFKAGCTLKQNDDGSYSLIPRYLPILPILFCKTGTYTAEVCVDGKKSVKASAQFELVPDKKDTESLPSVILTLAIIMYLIYLLFIKQKFEQQTIHYECWQIDPDENEGILQRGSTSSLDIGFFSGHFLLPGRASIKYRDLKIMADTGGIAVINGESIAKSVYAYGPNSSDPKDNLSSIAEQLYTTVRPDGTKQASDQTLSSTPIYFKNSENNNTIWRIWVTK